MAALLVVTPRGRSARARGARGGADSKSRGLGHVRENANLPRPRSTDAAARLPGSKRRARGACPAHHESEGGGEG